MRAFVGGLFILALIAMVMGVAGMADGDAKLERERQHRLQLLEAEAGKSEQHAAELAAAADKAEADANLERAQGQRSREEAMGRAIEAPALAAARAVDVQSNVVASMGRTNTLIMRSIPAGLIVGVAMMLMGAFALGIVGAMWLSWWLSQSKLNAAHGVLLPAGSHDTDPFVGQDEPAAHGIQAHIHQFDS